MPASLEVCSFLGKFLSVGWSCTVAGTMKGCMMLGKLVTSLSLNVLTCRAYVFFFFFLYMSGIYICIYISTNEV